MRHDRFVIGALVLAAGGSARLGQPKQLLRFRGETLIRHAVRAAQEAGCAPLVIVAGRDQETIAQELADLPVTLVPNELWERGLGTSIRAGVAALPPEVEAVVILACDQPHVDATHLLNLLAERQRTDKPIVASAYAGTRGVPALFTREYFPMLLSLGDEQGAKEILRAYRDGCSEVSCAAGAIDIDTPEDYAALR
ncbi:MAG: nucleotidyltransferase family protein [Chthoniobacterales bacterium]